MGNSKDCFCAPKRKEGCDWWIDSPEYGNCFWTFAVAASDEEGYMEELTQSEIAQLLGISHGKANALFKEAMQQLQESVTEQQANTILSEGEY